MTKAMMKIWIFPGILAIALFGAVLVARLVPQSSLGGILFQVRWKVSMDRRGLLKDYGEHFASDSPRFLPETVDHFLCEKFRIGSEQPELNEIADFYVALAGGKEGNCFANIGKKVAETVMRRINSYEDPLLRRKALLTVEESRMGTQLFKARLDPPAEVNTVDLAIQKYVDWISSPMEWEKKRMINPLAQSGIAWYIP